MQIELEVLVMGDILFAKVARLLNTRTIEDDKIPLTMDLHISTLRNVFKCISHIGVKQTNKVNAPVELKNIHLLKM